MPAPAQVPETVRDSQFADGWEDFLPLTPAEALVWSQRNPQPSLWRGWWLQLVAGLVLVLVAGLGYGMEVWSQSVLVSCVYGVLIALVPSALAVRGVDHSRCQRSAGASLAAVLMWEGVKVLVAVVALLLAPMVLGQFLQWLVLLAAFVVVLKIYFLGFIHVAKNADGMDR